MRTLIDGYNLMYAIGLLGGKFGPDGFRKVRHRFLNDLVAALDPLDAHRTTVVFDATNPPLGAPRQTGHKGLTVLFAVDDEDADARIEAIIARDAAPKTLKVVSSDRRVMQAATRRKAVSVSADDFWDHLKARKAHKPSIPRPPTAEERGRVEGPSAAEAAFWLAEFEGLDEIPETKEALRSADFVPTDEEIERIMREVDDEFRGLH